MLSTLQGTDLEEAAKKREQMKRKEQKMLEEKKRLEDKKKYDEYRKTRELELDTGEGTSDGLTRHFKTVSILDSLKVEVDDLGDYMSQPMAPSTDASGAPGCSHWPDEPTPRQIEEDNIALAHKGPSTSTSQRRSRRIEPAVVEDYDQPSTSTNVPARVEEEEGPESDTTEEEGQNATDQEFVPPPESARATRSRYSLRSRGAQARNDEEPAPSNAQTQKTKTAAEENQNQVKFNRPIMIGPDFQADTLNYVLDRRNDYEMDRDELFYTEREENISHETIRNVFYRVLWRQFQGLIPFEFALRLLMKNKHSMVKALETLDDELRERCRQFEPPESFSQIQHMFYDPLYKDHDPLYKDKGTAKARAYEEDTYSFKEEDRKEFFWFCRDQHVKRNPSKKANFAPKPCYCRDPFTKEIPFEPRWGCSNCTKKNRGSDRLCLICQLYQEQTGVQFPAKNVHFTKHDLKQMKAWEEIEAREGRSIIREEFEKFQKEDEQKWLQRIRQTKKAHTNLPRQEYEHVKKYYTVYRERPTGKVAPRDFEKIGGPRFAQLLTPHRLEFLKPCSCKKTVDSAPTVTEEKVMLVSAGFKISTSLNMAINKNMGRVLELMKAVEEQANKPVEPKTSRVSARIEQRGSRKGRDE